jgi:putative NADPH-quinone reductase
MKVLVVLGHPDPNSFNHAIASAVCETLRKNGHTVIFHDLCVEGFDPFLPKEEIPEDGLVPALIQQHCEELVSADGIVIVHPNWWGQPPAVLKGWVDRVFRPGVAYRFEDGDSGEGVPIGLLKAKAALVLNTSNTPDGREKSVFGDPLEALWKRCIFGMCGVRTVHRRMFNVVVTSTLEERRKWLGEAEELTTRLFPQEGHNQQAHDTPL